MEVVLTAVSLADLARRSADEVRRRCGLAVLVRPVGRVAYLALGRRSG